MHPVKILVDKLLDTKVVMDLEGPMKMLYHTEGVQALSEAAKVIKEATKEPVLSLNQLTATETIDRQIMAETRRRIQVRSSE
jgi:hypothetical protein